MVYCPWRGRWPKVPGKNLSESLRYEPEGLKGQSEGVKGYSEGLRVWKARQSPKKPASESERTSGGSRDQPEMKKQRNRTT